MSLVVSFLCLCVLAVPRLYIFCTKSLPDASFLSCTIWFRELHIIHRAQQNIRHYSLAPFSKTQVSHVLIF
ncbi:hypothetical protein ERO13_A05G407250v2 [Gossypium hirsutum]|uniref:Uncharacterized protein n=1 Tax=Gossypium mustelinum TaxID=34275 RepID=A0A5D2ZIK3_GOSMU|nr:hypothetical protein ERO13_A05G407250v2 [Gossypium hirsutum]TYJ38412.1 hypothetical protein E1A91_A05G441300v1 [Gossypium mustelinum]